MEQKKTVVDRIWDFFTSIKLAIVLFLLISLTSIVGTIIEQRAEPQKNIELLSRLFNPEIAPTLYRILDALHFTDMYRSWWFVTLLMLFAANLIICSLDRLPKVLKFVKEDIKPLSDEVFLSLPVKREIVVTKKPETMKEILKEVFKKHGFNLKEDNSSSQLFSQKGAFSRLGVYITHLSILIILAGALIGIFFGFKGFLNIREGMAYSVAFRGGMNWTHQDEVMVENLINVMNRAKGSIEEAARLMNTTPGELKGTLKHFGIEPLGFEISCEDFEVEFYGNSDMPKDYKSLLSVRDKDLSFEKWIEVNAPLKYKGYTFYQSSYGTWPGVRGIFKFRFIDKNGHALEKSVHPLEEFDLPGGLRAKVVDFSPAIAFDETGRPFTYAEQMNNPAALVEFNKKEFNRWILKRYPQTWHLPDGSSLEFVDYWGVQYTGLQVRRDPGVWLVYLGCIIMAAGLYITFFTSHRRLWLRLLPEKGGTRLFIGGSVNRNREAFERQIDRIIKEVQ
ncbi:MAG: cytochrome c biogenesis protein ResB [Thermodesulfovibrionales bacterium]|nr:cytochrome c biogenesis protein ResB [Thermodesulfovibrionales bacterium]